MPERGIKLDDKFIITLSTCTCMYQAIMRNITHLLPSVLLLELCTCNNADDGKWEPLLPSVFCTFDTTASHCTAMLQLPSISHMFLHLRWYTTQSGVDSSRVKSYLLFESTVHSKWALWHFDYFLKLYWSIYQAVKIVPHFLCKNAL